jgi:hypothetical protein
MPDVTTQAADVLRALDLASVVVFAITGALVASRKQIDIVGFLWLGLAWRGDRCGWGNCSIPAVGCPSILGCECYPTGALARRCCYSSFFGASCRVALPHPSYLDAFGMALLTTVGTAKALDMGGRAPWLRCAWVSSLRRWAASCAIFQGRGRRSCCGATSMSPRRHVVRLRFLWQMASGFQGWPPLALGLDCAPWPFGLICSSQFSDLDQAECPGIVVRLNRPVRRAVRQQKRTVALFSARSGLGSGRVGCW